MGETEASKDADLLKAMASNLSYDHYSESVIKHRLYEIAMRIETGFYNKTDGNFAMINNLYT